jgi:hypothetical protein
MKDRSNGLFEPDALLPSQFYAAFRTGSAIAGEKRLMLAVLEDALDCFRKYASAIDGQGMQMFRDVDVWITSRDRRWFYSYENICDTLEIDPDYLRDGLGKWRRVASEVGAPPVAVASPGLEHSAVV